MAKANVILLNSILWNLREITKLADKIKKHCGDVDCTSWRYPLTSCSELEIFKLLQNNRNLDNYTYILELTYDRLLYVFNLLIKYLESNDSMERFRPQKNVQRPKTLSLATVLYMIWERIKAQVENSNQLETKPTEINKDEELQRVTASKSTISTQSEVSSITICSCCEMVQLFVTQLILDIERTLQKHDCSSAISSERTLMRESLQEMTTWSAMTRWLAAIGADFNTLSTKAEQASLNSRKLLTRIDSNEQKMKANLEEIKKLDRTVQDLKQTINGLEQKNSQLAEEVQQRNRELASVKSDYESKLSELKKSYDEKIIKTKQKFTKKEMEKEALMKKKYEEEHEKLLEVENENERLIARINKLSEQLEVLNMKKESETSSLESLSKSLESEVEELKNENSNLKLTVAENQKVIEKYSSKLTEAFPDLNETKRQYKASGNPMIDMENQLEANKIRIDLLNEENNKLTKTLEKLKAMKS